MFKIYIKTIVIIFTFIYYQLHVFGIENNREFCDFMQNIYSKDNIQGKII